MVALSFKKTAAAKAEFRVRVSRRHRNSEINTLVGDIAAVKTEIAERKLNPAPTPTQQRVAAILGDEIAPGIDLPARLHDLSKRRGDLEAARAELARRLSDERARASRLVCDQVAEHHKRLVRNICQKFIALHAANVAYALLADDLNAQDIMWTFLRPMAPHWLGGPRDNQGRVAQYLREAAEFGFISRDDIPKELR